MSGFVARLCLTVLILLAATATAEAVEPAHTTETNGLALSVGTGNQYPLLGIQASFYVQMPGSLFRVVPYFGVGALVCAYTDEQSACTTGSVVGVMGSWGHKHRAVLNLSYGTVGALALQLHGQLLDATSIEGVGLAVGYEYMTFAGFFLRADIGLAYRFLPPLLQNDSPVALTITLIGIGLKLW